MPTDIPWTVVALLVVAAVAAGMLVAAIRARRGVYVLRGALFTPAERMFLSALEKVLPSGVRVFGKVRLADIFGVKSGLSARARQGAFNRVSLKHVDFLLVRSGDLAPLAGIELDDRSHEAADRQARDAFVDRVFASAGLPLLHVPAQKGYDLADLKAKLAALVAK